MLGKPRLELGVALEDELKSLTDDVIEVVGAEELGVALHRLSERFFDADEKLARCDPRFRWLE